MNKHFPVLVTAQFSVAILASVMDWLGVSKELKETREAVKQAADAMALAVPGERYQRIIDAVHKGTPEQQKEAKAFIKSLFKIDPDASYEVSVDFSFDTSSKTKLRADIFAGGTPYLADVKAYVANSLNPDPPVSSNVLIPMTDGEIWTAIQKIIQRNLVGVYGGGNERVYFTPNRGGSFMSPQTFISPQWQVVGGNPQELVNDLTSAIWMLRGERPLPLTPSRSIPYNPFLGLDYIFVVINQEDLEKVTAGKPDDSFIVKIMAHEVGHADKPLPLAGPRPFVLGKKDFLLPDHPTVTHPTKGTFVWAERQVTQYQGISEQYLQKLDQLRQLSQKYNNL